MRQDTGTGSDELRILQLGWMLFLKIFSDKDKELELLQDDYRSPIPAELHWDQWAGDDEGITGDELVKFVDQKLFPTLANIDLSSGNKRALLVREIFANNYNYMKSGIHLRQVINKLNQIDFNSSKDKQIFGQIYEGFLGELQSAGTLGDNVIGWEYKPMPYLLANTNLILHDINLPSIRYGDSLAQPLSQYRHRDRADLILANPPFGGVVSDNNESNFPQSYRTKESADLFLILMIHLLKDGGRAAIVLPDGSLTGDGVKQRIRQKLLEDCNLHTIIRLPNSVFQPYASVATNLLFFTKGTATQNVWYYEHQLPTGYKAYSKTKPIQLAEFDNLKTWWRQRQASQQAWSVDIASIKANGYNLDIKNPHQPQAEQQHSSTELLDLLQQSFSKSDQLLEQLRTELR